MPKVPIDNVFLVGVNRDVDPIELDPAVWTLANNARMTVNGITNVKKHSLKMAPLAIEDATGIFYFGKNNVDFWVTCNGTKAAADEGGGYTLFTNNFTAPGAANNLGWNGTNFHGIQLLNNGLDVPVYWDGLTKGVLLPDFPGWPIGQAGSTPNLIQNPLFESDTKWTKGTGWTIGSGKASSDGSQTGDSDLTQTPTTALIETEVYVVEFTVSNRTAGGVTPVVGGTLGTLRGANGTFSEEIAAGSGADLDIRANSAFVGSIDDVSIRRKTVTLITAKAQVIRSFLNFIIALNITDEGTSPDTVHDKRVLWSHSASPGNMPISWDYTDKELLAGHQDLTNTNGAIVDGLPLGNLFLVYKEDSLWAMNYVGAPLVFDFIKISDNIHLLTQNCVVETPVGHVLLANGDFMVHTGDGSYQSPLTRRYRNSLFQDIDPDNIDRCFLVRQPLFNEVWVCYPELGQSLCTKALVWNWETGSLYTRDLEGFYDGVFGLQIPPEAARNWNDETTLQWGDDSFTWDTQYEELTRNSLVMVGRPDEVAQTGTADTAYLRLMDVFDGDVLTDNTVLERVDLAVAGVKRDGTPRVDRYVRKLIREIWPRLEISGDGVTITVEIGGRENLHDEVVYDFSYTYDPKTQDRIHTLINRPYVAIRFTFSFTAGQNGVVNFYGYDLLVERAGSM